MPISLTGRASMTWLVQGESMSTKHIPVKNSCSILTASTMIALTTSGWGRRLRWLKSKQAKSVCMPSSRLISSFEKVRPGMSPRFFIQNMEAKEPEKNIPSTAAKAMRRSAKVERWSEIHFKAHSALRLMQGMVSIASKRYSRWTGSLMYVSIKRE